MMRLLSNAIHDGRYALRTLRHSPGFATGVILTLALGIGANVAMFGIVDRLMFRPHAYLRDPGSAHLVYLRNWHRGALRTNGSYEYTVFEDLKRWTTSFTQIAAFAHQVNAVGLGDAARERRVGQVSASFFEFFDAPPALGRYFTAAEDTVPRGADVAVLGYAFWQSEYGGRDVLGAVIHVGNIPATIVGVAPEGFSGVYDADPPAVYIPITTYAGSQPSQLAKPTYYTRYDWGWMNVMVRRKPGVTIEQASADATQSYRRSWMANMAFEPTMPSLDVAKPFAEVSSLRSGAGPDPGMEARTALWVTGVAVIVLLIACANVANLFVARALRRQRETAVRLALGAGRGRLMTQHMTESLVLALLGGFAGLVVAHWGGTAIRRTLISSQGASLDVMTDWRALGVAAAVALLAGVVTGVVPGVVTGRGDLTGSLKSGSRGAGQQRSRARTTLLVLQGALSMALLVGAGLFVRSLGNVNQMRLGYDPEGVLLVARQMRGMSTDSVTRVALRRALLAAAQQVPGVRQAAYVSSIPLWSTSVTDLFVQGIDSVRQLGRFTYQTGTPGMFGALGTRVIRGREFTDADRDGAPRVAVVSESMARVLWPGRDALGQCFRVGKPGSECVTVVGIAEDIVQEREQLGVSERYHYYLPIEQYGSSGGSYLLVRMGAAAAPQAEVVRKALQPMMPGQAYVTVRPLIEVVYRTRASWKLGATMFVAFGVLALVVAAVGLYSVISYGVAQRMHELGVRVALGAHARDILRLVVGQALRFAFAGVVAGGVLALFAGRWLEPLLFRQSVRDPVIYGAVGALMLVVALVASAAPALRAATVDPNTALRSE